MFKNLIELKDSYEIPSLSLNTAKAIKIKNPWAKEKRGSI